MFAHVPKDWVALTESAALEAGQLTWHRQPARPVNSNRTSECFGMDFAKGQRRCENSRKWQYRPAPGRRPVPADSHRTNGV